MSAPYSINARAGRVHHVARDHGHVGRLRAHSREGLDHPVLVPVRRVDDEHVGAGFEQLGGLGPDVTVHADGGGDPQPPTLVDGGRVERGAQRAAARQDAEQLPVLPHGHRGERSAGVVEPVEDLAGIGVRT